MPSKQLEVKEAITATDKRKVVIENRLEELNLSEDEKQGSDDPEDRHKALRQFQEELQALESSRKLLQELLSKSQEQAVASAAKSHGPPMTVTFGKCNSGFQAGAIHGSVSGLTFGSK